MECKAGRWKKTPLHKVIFTVTPSLEGQPTNANKALPPRQVKLTQLDANPVFPILRDNSKLVSEF